jgi:hypothetical protein
MKLLAIIALAAVVGVVQADADSFRVRSIGGSGRVITIQAESTSEARRTVMDMFAGAVVTDVSPIKKTIK